MPKLKAVFLALVFPAFYFFVRLLAQQVWLLAVGAGERARAPWLDEVLLRGKVSEAVERYTPWILITGAVITVALLLALFARKKGGLAAVVGMAPMRGGGTALRIAALGIGLNTGLTALMSFLPIPADWISEHSSSVSDPLAASGPFAMALCVVFVVPIVEETIFRGLSHTVLGMGFPPVIALLWQAMLFAGFHGTKLQLVYAFLAALAIGAVYKWQGTLRAPLLAHMTFNAMSLVWPGAPDGTAARAAVLAISAAIVALTLFALRRSSSAAEKPALRE